MPLRTVSAGQSVTVQVPATSANLGPGFDSLGLAVALYDTLTVETSEAPGLQFDLRGEGSANLPKNESHLSVRCIALLLNRFGFQYSGLKITADNVIPHGRGLGSSAAAAVAALLAAAMLLPESDRPSLEDVFQLGCEVEGHPDNVAPAVFGGMTASWVQGSRSYTTSIEVDPRIRPVVAVPTVELSTETARAMLPSSVSHQSAAANTARAAVLIHAISRAPELLFVGTEDFLHQQYRFEAMPASGRLLRLWRQHGIPAVISGAGPTVLALTGSEAQRDEALQVARSAEEFATATDSSDTPGATWQVSEVGIATEGAKVVAHRQF